MLPEAGPLDEQQMGDVTVYVIRRSATEVFKS